MVNSIEPKMETETEMNYKCPIGSLFKYFPNLVLSTDLRTQSSDFQRLQESTQFQKPLLHYQAPKFIQKLTLP